jgi:predicted nucleic acid-binding protein
MRLMSASSAFFDTNVLIYLYSHAEPYKKEAIIELLSLHKPLIISTQVVSEFINVMLKKHQASYKHIAVALQEEILIKFDLITVTKATIQRAVAIADRYRYSYYDSLIIAAALDSNASILYSEDMHHQHIIEDSLCIVNPFNHVKDFHYLGDTFSKYP